MKKEKSINFHLFIAKISAKKVIINNYLLLVLLLISISLTSCFSGQTKKKGEQLIATVNQIKKNDEPVTTVNQTDSLAYSIFSEKISDSTRFPKKVVIDIILNEEEYDKKQLSDLLYHIYDEKLEGSKMPITIGIRAYNTLEHAKSGMGQWAGMLSKSYTELKPRLLFNEVQINFGRNLKEEKFGLAEEVRVEIWQRIVKAQDQANAEAEKKYPLDGTNDIYWNGSNYNEAKFKENMDKNMKLNKELRIKYEKQVYARYKISDAIADSISSEAFKEGWAFPE